MLVAYMERLKWPTSQSKCDDRQAAQKKNGLENKFIIPPLRTDVRPTKYEIDRYAIDGIDVRTHELLLLCLHRLGVRCLFRAHTQRRSCRDFPIRRELKLPIVGQ